MSKFYTLLQSEYQNLSEDEKMTIRPFLLDENQKIFDEEAVQVLSDYFVQGKDFETSKCIAKIMKPISKESYRNEINLVKNCIQLLNNNKKEEQSPMSIDEQSSSENLLQSLFGGDSDSDVEIIEKHTVKSAEKLVNEHTKIMLSRFRYLSTFKNQCFVLQNGKVINMIASTEVGHKDPSEFLTLDHLLCDPKSLHDRIHSFQQQQQNIPSGILKDNASNLDIVTTAFISPDSKLKNVILLMCAGVILAVDVPKKITTFIQSLSQELHINIHQCSTARKINSVPMVQDHSNKQKDMESEPLDSKKFNTDLFQINNVVENLKERLAQDTATITALFNKVRKSINVGNPSHEFLIQLSNKCRVDTNSFIAKLTVNIEEFKQLGKTIQ